MDLINEQEIAGSPQAAAVAAQNGQRIGHIYTKAMFREFTDGTFTARSERPAVTCKSTVSQVMHFLMSYHSG